MKDLSDIKNSDIKIVIDEYIHSERDRAVLLERVCRNKSDSRRHASDL